MLRYKGSAVIAMVMAVVQTASAQVVPWATPDDPLSDSLCGVINAKNAQLVLISSTNQLAIVTGNDLILEDTLVDEAGLVFFEGNQVGSVGYATDGDGLRSIWWTSLTGTIVELDEFTAQPSPTNEFPADFHDVPCDVCEFWDNPAACVEPEPPVTVNVCGADVVLPTSLMATLFATLSLVRRRR